MVIGVIIGLQKHSFILNIVNEHKFSLKYAQSYSFIEN